MFCQKCGNQLNEGAVFCPKCGTPINRGRDSQSTSKPQQKANIRTKKNNVLIIIAIAAVVLIGIITVIRSCSKSTPSQPEVGKPFYFGRYPQSSSSDKEEDILWDVVAEENGNYMLLSHYVLDCQPYDTSAYWLNSEFKTVAFNDEELGRLANGNVMLLSLYDIESLMSPENVSFSSSRLGYILSSGKLACPATDYAKSCGVTTVSIDELTDGHSEYNASLFSSVKNEVGSDAKNNITEYWLLSDLFSDNMNYGVTFTFAGNVYSTNAKGGIRPVVWIKGEKKSDKNEADLPNYDQYIGEWECVGDIGHPDGSLIRYGHKMSMSKKGVDCTDLFGNDASWSYLEDLKYYSDNGNDYYVDFTGDPMGFYYDKSVNQMIIYTPSSNNPSDNPLEWYDRMRFERK